MKLPVHPSDILIEHEDLKKLYPESFRAYIETPFIKSQHIAEMKVRINEHEKTVKLVIYEPPIFGSIDHQDTMLIKFPLEEVFEMLKSEMRDGKLSRIAIQGHLRLSKLNPNSLNE